MLLDYSYHGLYLTNRCRCRCRCRAKAMVHHVLIYTTSKGGGVSMAIRAGIILRLRLFAAYDNSSIDGL
jgi:hypothetical protein